MCELILSFLCVELVSTSPFSLIGRRREAGSAFHIRASYVSYSFVVASWFSGISAVGRIALGILFGLSQSSWFCGSWLDYLCTVFHFFSYLPFFSPIY